MLGVLGGPEEAGRADAGFHRLTQFTELTLLGSHRAGPCRPEMSVTCPSSRSSGTRKARKGFVGSASDALVEMALGHPSVPLFTAFVPQQPSEGHLGNGPV